MGQKFFFVLVGCIFVAIAGSIFVNDNYIDWPIYREPTINNVSAISGCFDPLEAITKEEIQRREANLRKYVQSLGIDTNNKTGDQIRGELKEYAESLGIDTGGIGQDQSDQIKAAIAVHNGVKEEDGIDCRPWTVRESYIKKGFSINPSIDKSHINN